MTSYWGSVQPTEAVLEVQNLLEGLAPGEGDLLEALHRVQHHYGYVPKEAIPGVAKQLRLPPARVYGAVTYFAELRQTPPPETLISWCSGPSCYIKGGANIRAVLEKMLGCGMHLGQCNGTCDNAPQVWVNGKVVGPLGAADTVELVDKLKEGEQP
jgi:NADH-quinone oxidoreductase subunit E